MANETLSATEPTKVRKKPVVIEAMRFNGTISSADAIELWTFGATRANVDLDGPTAVLTLYVETQHGLTIARPGDFVLRGVNGEFYPCKPDVFAETYELA